MNRRPTVVRIFPRNARIALAALAFLGLASCKEDIAQPLGVESVVVAPNDLKLPVNGTQQLVAQPYDRTGKALTGQGIVFLSDDRTIATVSPTGLVVAVTLGKTKVKAVAGGKTGEVAIEVIRDVAGRLDIEPPGGQVVVEGEKRTLIAKVMKANGDPLTDRQVSWTTSNPLVALVASTGLQTAQVTAVKAGPVVITASVEGVVQVSQFQVIPSRVQVSYVRVTPAGPQILRVTGKLRLTATPFDVDNNALPGRTVSWFSSNPLVASVDPVTGEVTAIAPGNASVVADIETRQAIAPITVTLIPIKSVTVTPKDLNLFETVAGSPVTQKMTLVVRDTTDTVISTANRTVVWTSSDVSAAIVNGQTEFVGTGQPGVSIIKVTVDNVADSTTVTVKKRNVATVLLQPINPQTVQVGNSFAYSVNALDSAQVQLPLLNRTVTWTTSDPAIATISSLGILLAVKDGTATVTANVDGKSDTRSVTIVPKP